jgi:hypothetical protein
MLIGKRPITDRKRIAEFLNLLNKNPQYKFIILDLYLKDSSDRASDLQLQTALTNTKNILIPYHKGPDGFALRPIVKASQALSDYEKVSVENKFLQFKLVQGDSLKTTPLVMYESLTGKKFKSGTVVNHLDNQLSLNNFLIDFTVFSRDINRSGGDESGINAGRDSSRYNILYLSDLLGDQLRQSLPLDSSMPEKIAIEIREAIVTEYVKEQISNFTKDRIIIIGDFSEADIHDTIHGRMPGPLILLNIFLSLESGDNLYNLWFILFLFIGYFIVSYKCYTHYDLLDDLLWKLVAWTGVKRFSLSFMGYILYFIILSVFSYFIFNIQLTILILALYMELLEWVVKYLQTRAEKKPIQAKH